MSKGLMIFQVSYGMFQVVVKALLEDGSTVFFSNTMVLCGLDSTGYWSKFLDSGQDLTKTCCFS